MKAMFVLLSLWMVIHGSSGEERPWTTKEDWAEVQRNGSPVGKELAEALNGGDPDAIRSRIRKAAEQGEWKLGSNTLYAPKRAGRSSGPTHADAD
jgi:hypothetical protein